MSDRPLGPLGMIAILTGVGLFGGRNGRAVLRRLRRLVAWALVAGMVFTVIAAFTTGPGERALPFLFGVLGVIALAVLWCMIAFAAWLTRPDDNEGKRGRLAPADSDEHADEYLPSPKTQWHELLGVHPDDGREEIVAALEREARDGATWYEAIDVSPYATRREIVDALRREFDHLMDAVDEEIGDIVRQKYGRPNRRG